MTKALVRRALAPILFAVLAFGRTVTLPAQDATPRPWNLIVIHTDEHHFGTLGCYGGKIVGTPHIDWIARQGALCTAFYATTPVCSPSRAAFVTGLYPQHTAVVTNNIPMRGDVVTFAEVLRRRGYATGYAGKWHLDGSGKPQWAPKRKFGFDDNRFMFNRGHWKKLIDAPGGPQVGSRKNNGRPDYSLDGADDKTFTTDWLCDKAVNFIRQHREQPFCYMVSLPDPHGPNTVRPPYDTMFADVKVPIPKSLGRDLQSRPSWGRPAGVTARQLQRIMPPYYGMVKCIDDNVGKILRTLREAKVIDHTIIVFTSDHGDLCGEHGRLNKGVPYEGSARVPFLVVCPGKIGPGTVVDEALSCVDFLPTVLKLMNVSIDHDVDGRDASRLLAGKVEAWDDMTFLRSTSSRAPWLCAVTANYKLVVSAADDPWLVDLKKDPDELDNLFNKDELAPVARRLATRLGEYCKQNDDEYARVPRIREALSAILANGG